MPLELLELLLQKKRFCAVLPNLFLAVVTEHLIVPPNLLFISVLQSHPMGMCMDVLGAEGSVQSLQCCCRHITLPKQDGSCDYPNGELCLLLTWTV